MFKRFADSIEGAFSSNPHNNSNSTSTPPRRTSHNTGRPHDPQYDRHHPHPQSQQHQRTYPSRNPNNYQPRTASPARDRQGPGQGPGLTTNTTSSLGTGMNMNPPSPTRSRTPQPHSSSPKHAHAPFTPSRSQSVQAFTYQVPPSAVDAEHAGSVAKLDEIRIRVASLQSALDRAYESGDVTGAGQHAQSIAGMHSQMKELQREIGEVERRRAEEKKAMDIIRASLDGVTSHIETRRHEIHDLKRRLYDNLTGSNTNVGMTPEWFTKLKQEILRLQTLLEQQCLVLDGIEMSNLNALSPDLITSFKAIRKDIVTHIQANLAHLDELEQYIKQIEDMMIFLTTHLPIPTNTHQQNVQQQQQQQTNATTSHGDDKMQT